MPELPDVETFKRYMDSTSLHKAIEAVQVRSAKILENVSSRKLQASLRGRQFESTRRHGKYLMAQIDDGSWLTFHFGMTGRFKYFKDMENEPDHSRLRIRFKSGFHLAYDCQRQLGRVGLVEDAETLVQDKGLGPDAITVDLPAFKERLQRARGSVKSALMNQRLIAGIGNIYSDEILFQAGLHPRTKVNHLDERELRRVFRTMKRVLRTAVDRQADPRRLPRSYLIPRRGRSAECPHCAGELESIKVSGRTAYYCPGCQPGG